jgi:hypothetical protein
MGATKMTGLKFGSSSGYCTAWNASVRARLYMKKAKEALINAKMRWFAA